MSDTNKDLKPGNLYVDPGSGRAWIVANSNSLSDCNAIVNGVPVREPKTDAEKRLVEDSDLQEKADRAFIIAEEVMDKRLSSEFYQTGEWSQIRATLAAAILAKMK